MRVNYYDMVNEFERVLNKYGLAGNDGHLAATLFADASRDGVPSHGLNRFPVFIENIRKGIIKVDKRARLVSSMGVLERWDGEEGPGNINAYIAMKRAMEIAGENTVGAVALSHTNHWLRAGNYGLMAAENGFIGILWTNTMPNMAPWGSKDILIGNNPIVFAAPGKEGPLLLDTAMSLFSYGKLEKYMLEGKKTPFDAGLDKDGNVTRDPEKIIESRSVFPIGYWKGSGLSIALDIIAAMLSGGDTTRLVGERGAETSLSQVFIAVDTSKLPDRERIEREVENTLEEIRKSTPVDSSSSVHAPGDGMMKMRLESMRDGVPVDEGRWKMLLEM